MGRTSNEAKQHWNANHYTQLKISVDPELVAAFKAKCISEGVSMASEISKFMTVKTSGVSSPPLVSTLPYGTRQKRRKAISKMIAMLTDIKDAEQGYLDRIPVNLQSSDLYEAAEETVGILEEAADILLEAY